MTTNKQVERMARELSETQRSMRLINGLWGCVCNNPEDFAQALLDRGNVQPLPPDQHERDENTVGRFEARIEQLSVSPSYPHKMVRLSEVRDYLEAKKRLRTS